MMLAMFLILCYLRMSVIIRFMPGMSQKNFHFFCYFLNIIIIMVIFKCYFSGELIALS